MCRTVHRAAFLSRPDRIRPDRCAVACEREVHRQLLGVVAADLLAADVRGDRFAPECVRRRGLRRPGRRVEFCRSAFRVGGVEPGRARERGHPTLRLPKRRLPRQRVRQFRRLELRPLQDGVCNSGLTNMGRSTPVAPASGGPPERARASPPATSSSPPPAPPIPGAGGRGTPEPAWATRAARTRVSAARARRPARSRASAAPAPTTRAPATTATRQSGFVN